MANATTISGFLKDNLGTIGIGVGSAVIGGALGYSTGRYVKSKKRKTKFKASHRKKYSSGRRVKRGQRQPYTAGKRKDTSHRRIRFTKRNQPYIILSSGKARFIKKSSVRNARRRKGGMY